MAQEYNYGHLSDDEYRKLAKAVNQRMVQAEKDGRTNDPQYMSLQRVLSSKGKGATKGGKYRFPEAPSRMSESEKQAYKQVLDEYRFALFASERSQKQAMQRRLKELEKIPALSSIVGDYRKSMSDKRVAFNIVYSQFTHSMTSRATGPMVDEIKRRFEKYLRTRSTYYSEMTKEIKEWLLDALASGALEGQFSGSSATYDSQDEIESLAEVAISIGNKVKPDDEDTTDIGSDNKKESDWIIDLLRRWLSMDATSRSRYGSIKKFIDDNWFH